MDVARRTKSSSLSTATARPHEVPAAKAEEALGRKIMHYIPEDAKAVNRANNHGVPLVIEAPTAKVSKSMFQLSSMVDGSRKK